MIQAAQIADLNCVRLMADTTAAALDYAFFKSAKKEFDKTKPQHVLFIDLGYAGLSVALIACYEGRLEVLSTSSNPSIGGRRYDEAIVRHLSEVFQKQTGVTIGSDHKALINLQNPEP